MNSGSTHQERTSERRRANRVLPPFAVGIGRSGPRGRPWPRCVARHDTYRNGQQAADRTAKELRGTAGPDRAGAGRLGDAQWRSAPTMARPSPPAPAASPATVGDSRGRGGGWWGEGENHHRDLPAAHLRAPSPEKDAPRADENGYGQKRQGRPQQLRSRRGGSAMLPGGTSAIRPPTATTSHPPPAAPPPVPESRGRGTERWGDEGADHHNLTPDHLRPPLAGKNAPGPTTTAGPASPGAGGLGDPRRGRSRSPNPTCTPQRPSRSQRVAAAEPNGGGVTIHDRPRPRASASPRQARQPDDGSGEHGPLTGWTNIWRAILAISMGIARCCTIWGRRSFFTPRHRPGPSGWRILDPSRSPGRVLARQQRMAGQTQYET